MKTALRLKIVNAGFAVAALAAVAYFYSLFQSGLFSNDGFMPHGHCYLWSKALVSTMVVSDLLIGLAYVSISVCLYILVRRIQLPFSTMFLAFGAFIAACGGTHFMEVYTLWVPNYWLAALVKVVTALASVATALIMFPLFPRVVALASTARLSEERKKQLEAANLELKEREKELLMLNQELESFSYSVAHDLRSPLRAINGFAQALGEDYSDRLDAQGLEFIDFITDGSKKMGRLIDDLLELSRVTRKEVSVANCNLSDTAINIISILRAGEPDRVVDVAIQEGVRVQGDGGLLRIVILNLLSNAWKFTRDATGARIEFGEKFIENRRVIFVRDNGVGFDMQFVGKLFSPFQRLHRDEDFQGTGIGLATAKRILSRHRGEIWVESQVGRGTTFYFTLDGVDHGRA